MQHHRRATIKELNIESNGQVRQDVGRHQNGGHTCSTSMNSRPQSESMLLTLLTLPTDRSTWTATESQSIRH